MLCETENSCVKGTRKAEVFVCFTLQKLYYEYNYETCDVNIIYKKLQENLKTL